MTTARPHRASGGPPEARWEFRIAVEPDEVDGGWVATCLDLPGCVSQGETEQEALENVVDALSGILEVRMREAVGELEQLATTRTRRHEHVLAI